MNNQFAGIKLLLVVLIGLTAVMLPVSGPAQKSPVAESNPNAAPAICDPNAGLSDAEVAKVQEYVTIIEMKPSGIVVNNQGKVEQKPGHRPYNPDGTRNQNFRVTPDLSDAKVAAMVNHDQRRAQAIKSLAQMGSAAVPGLVFALMFEGHEHRPIYAFLLGELRDARAVPALIKYHEDGQMKFTIAASYRRMGDEAMAKQLENEGQRMKDDALTALKKIIGQELGTDIEKYQAWWEANKQKCGPAIQLQLYTANPPAGSSSPPQ